jgi:hypothetical protein
MMIKWLEYYCTCLFYPPWQDLASLKADIPHMCPKDYGKIVLNNIKA